MAGRFRQAWRALFGETPVQTRAITEFAIIDGNQVFGDGGGPSTYQGAMSIPGAWRASVILSDLLGAFPYHLFRETDDIATRLPTPPLLDQPAPPDTRMTTFSSFGLDLIYNGNAIGVWAARDHQGYPTAVVPVPARMVGVRRVGRESLSQLPVGAVEYKIGDRTFGAEDVFHVKGPCEPGAVRGMGVLEAHLNGALELAAEQMRQAKQVAHSGVPTGKLTTSNPDATQEEMKVAKAAWLQAQRDRTVAALSPSVDFEPVAWNPEEMQMVEARRMTREELALIFGLPARYLLASSGDSMTYSTTESERLDLLQTSSLVGHLNRFEAALTLARPRGQFVKANLDAWLRGATRDRYEAHNLGVTGGWLLKSEVRRIEDLPPVDGIDDPPPPAIPPTPDTTGADDQEDSDDE